MDEISVKNLEVFCHHGVYKEENVLGQKFLVDIISKVDTREAGKTDELALSVSYGDICRCVKKEMTKQNDKLLERVAERLAECILLQFPQIPCILRKSFLTSFTRLRMKQTVKEKSTGDQEH